MVTNKKQEHLDYKKRKGKARVSPLLDLRNTDFDWLVKWYNWGLGLLKGDIEPITREQSKLVSTFSQYLKPTRSINGDYDTLFVPKFDTSWWLGLGSKERLIVLNYLARTFPERFKRVYHKDTYLRKSIGISIIEKQEDNSIKLTKKQSINENRLSQKRLEKINCPNCGSIMFQARILDGFKVCVTCSQAEGTNLKLENTFYTREHYKQMRKIMKEEVKKNHRS